MQVLYRAKNLSQVKRHIVLHSGLICPDSAQKVTAFNEFHLEINICFIMKSRISFDNKVILMFGLAQEHKHVLLSNDMLCMLLGLDLFL